MNIENTKTLKQVNKRVTNTQAAYFEQFNKFQTLFFTDKNMFDKYTVYELKKFGYVLLNNIAKGFPNLADIICNLKGIGWDGITSIQILRALQSQLIGNFKRVPMFVFFKNMKPEKEKSKVKQSKVNKKMLDFDLEVKSQICSILMYDSKTYEELKYSDKVQYLGRQIVFEFMQTKTTRCK